MAALTAGCLRIPAHDAAVPHERLVHPISHKLTAIEIRRRRGRFAGTDALSEGDRSPTSDSWPPRVTPDTP